MGQKQRKQKETIKQTQAVSCTSHAGTINNSTKRDQKIEKI